VSRSMNPALVLAAYREGSFPWPVRQGLVPWASPDPRAIFPLEQNGKWPRSVRRAFKPEFRVSFDEAFGEVMRACGVRDDSGTWITPDILSTYDELHRLGWAHSIEVWNGAALVGGLYGVALGTLFAGESMYHRESGASKVAFASCADRLRERGFRLFDVQVLTGHLESLGCVAIPRDQYRTRAKECLSQTARFI
jgi:leucyl/phenylalanyl-tRNA---protein transferase